MKTKLFSIILGLTCGLLSLKAITIEYRYGTDNDLVTNYTGVSQAFLLVDTNPASFGNYNTGGFANMLVGRSNARQGIIAFDLSSLQGQASSIDSAQITFYRTGAETVNDMTISMYQLFGTNAGWNQGTGGGNAVGPDNSVTYLNQNYSSVPEENVPWKNSGGSGVGNASGAYDNGNLLDSVVYTSSSTEITFNIPLTVVESWINSPGTNAGLIFVPSGTPTGNTTIAILGNSSAAEQSRPLLTLTYTPIPEPATIGFLFMAGMLALVVKHRRRLR